MRPSSFLLLGITTVAIAAVAACSDGTNVACRVGADCASGACGPDGRCVPGEGAAPSASATDAPPATTSPGGDAGPPTGDASAGGCAPNHDGVITRDEVPLSAGLHATFRVAQNETVSTAGTPSSGGTRAWDFSAALGSDTDVLVETAALSGKWYAADYSGATYATTLSASSTLLGVFQVSAGAITLNGVVSPDSGITQTELTNSPAVSVLSFPLKASATWTSDTTVSGTAEGVLADYTENYASEVDASGTLKTPLGTFDVLRVKTTLTRTVGFVTTTIRSFAFVTECYGTVATVTSTDNESDVEFTNAAELRRIAP